MLRITYPSLYTVADAASLKAQQLHIRLTLIQAFFLLIGSILAINSYPTKLYSLSVAVVYFVALGLSLVLGLKKFEKPWYNGRAVAESIKTNSWRYAMRSAPFSDAESLHIPKAEFRNMLKSIIRSNRELGDAIALHQDTNEQITTEMEQIRALTVTERKNFYVSNRIDDQRQWYVKKAAYNKRMHQRWFMCLVIAQALAIACVLIRIAYPEWSYWPTDTLILFASFCISWTQLKKFNELSSAYSLTAQEIAIIRGQYESIETEEQLSDFINNAELAFSREHTQWVARQYS